MKNVLRKMWRFYLNHPFRVTVLGLYLLAVVLTGTVIGRVTDAETGEPVEGAVVAVSWEWRLPIPPEGQPVRALAETVSGKSGWFVMCHPTLLILSYPSVTVYSSEHVVWNNQLLFDGKSSGWPYRKKRPSRFWTMASLTPWGEEMSHCKQTDFLYRVGGSTKLIGETILRAQRLCVTEKREKRRLQGDQP